MSLSAKHNFYFLLGFVCIVLLSCSSKEQYDIFIYNGTVVDGTGAKAVKANIGISGSIISYVGDMQPSDVVANQLIDAEGQIVSPGFIDPHTHADRDLNKPETRHNLPFLMQGVTTTVVGNDGDSFYPFDKYQNLYNDTGVGTNVVQLLGHHEIIKAVIGNSNTKPSAEELTQMQELVRKEMEAGAFGISTGLYYAPGSYTATDEVISLAKVVAEYGGIYDTHLRDEGSSSVGLVAAVEEALEIGRQAKLPIHISHIKCLGVDVWKKSDTVIYKIEEAQREGLEVTANQYPYDASATSLNAAVAPRWAESGGIDSLLLRYNTASLKDRMLEETLANIERRGGPEKLLIVKCESEEYLGKTLAEVASQLRIPPSEAVYAVLETGYVRVASFNMNPYDIHNFMKKEWVVTGSDGNTGHPRKYGSFPRKFSKYVQEEKVIDLESFIRNSTLKTAEVFRIPWRGSLKEGFFADIIIFNPETFTDKADFKDAFQYAQGLNYAIVNGKISVENGEYTGAMNGIALKKELKN